MPNGARNWFYTLNNYTADELLLFSALPEGAVYHHFGEEVGESGTPHLQGVLGYATKRSISYIKKSLSRRLHLEPTRNVLRSIAYCSKDAVTRTFGTLPTANPQGSRSDLDAFKDAVKGGMYSVKDLREQHSSVVARYQRFCADYVADHKPHPTPAAHPLRPWQVCLEEALEGPPCSRTIYFIVDLLGNSGKSWYCDRYYHGHPGDTQILTPSKKQDMAYALQADGLRVLFLDCPRSKQNEFIQYDFLEDVKNKRVFSPKYESGMKYLPGCVHVVVMMNELPDVTKFSRDRYVVWLIEEGSHTVLDYETLCRKSNSF